MGTEAANTFKTALDVTSHNVANVIPFSGVSLYEAAAQIIATSQSIFQTLLSAVRG